MRELRIRLASSRSAPSADHLWRFVDAESGSERPWSGGLPEADRYFVFIPPERATLVELSPPPMSARKLEQAIPWLLEAQLIEPVEHFEFVRLPVVDGDASRIRLLVLEKDWLAEVRRQLASIGQGEVDWLLAGSQWRLPPATWAIRGDGGRAIFSSGDGRVLAVAEEGIAATIQALVSGSGDEPGRKPTLWHAGLAPATREYLAALAAELGISLVDAELPDEFDAATGAATVVFRQRRSALRKALGGLAAWPVWRAAAVVLALLVGVEVLAPILRWGQLSIEASRLRAASTELFRSTAGARAVVVDPWLQMRRLDQDRQHARGIPVADDFLPLLDAVSVLVPANAAPMTEVRYADRALEMVFANESAAAAGWLPDVQAALEAKGWRAQLLADSEGRSRQTLRVSAW